MGAPEPSLLPGVDGSRRRAGSRKWCWSLGPGLFWAAGPLPPGASREAISAGGSETRLRAPSSEPAWNVRRALRGLAGKTRTAGLKAAAGLQEKPLSVHLCVESAWMLTLSGSGGSCEGSGNATFLHKNKEKRKKTATLQATPRGALPRGRSHRPPAPSLSLPLGLWLVAAAPSPPSTLSPR